MFIAAVCAPRMNVFCGIAVFGFLIIEADAESSIYC